MRGMILTTSTLAVSTSISITQILLETAGRYYEATRQPAQMAMLLNSDVKEYKNIDDNNKELLDTFSDSMGERDSREIRDAWKAILGNTGMEGEMVKSDGYRTMNMYLRDVTMQETNKYV